MVPGRQELCPWRKNNVDNFHFSVTSSHDSSTSNVNGSFEKLLAQELGKNNRDGLKSVRAIDEKRSNKPFLKKGARGWWMQWPDAKEKVMKHTLASHTEVKMKKKPAMQRDLQPNEPSAFSSVSLSKPFLPEQNKHMQTIENALPTVSPSVALMHQLKSMKQEKNAAKQLIQTSNDDVAAWKNASLYSTTSTDILGMQNVRRSFEANQEREATDIAEFEAIERDLAAEKEAFLREKQQIQQDALAEEPERIHYDYEAEFTDKVVPYASFMSDLHEQEELRRQTARRDSSFDGSLDREIDQALVFHDYSAVLKENEMSEQENLTYLLRNHIGHKNRYANSPSDRVVSLDDSVPWDDDSQQGVALEDCLTFASTGFRVFSNKEGSSTDDGFRHQEAARRVYDAEHGDVKTNLHEYNRSGASDCIPEINDPDSALVHHMFRECEQDANSNSFFYKDGMSSIGDSSNHAAAWKSSSPLRPVQDRSSTNLAQKGRVKQKLPVTTTSTSKANGEMERTRQTNLGTAASPGGPDNQQIGSSNYTSNCSIDQSVQPTDSGMMLPTIIEEKLCELEAEVKFYKAKMLRLQKRKNFYDQERKELARERDEFERFQQEHRRLIEKELEQDCTEMKNEANTQERQWKLQMNSTISHPDRREYDELELLKTQIAKLQNNEKAATRKWKVDNENLRRRVLELKKINLELTDEIKFLQKDRLEQFEHLLIETREASESAPRSGVTCTIPFVGSEKNEVHAMNDVITTKGTADLFHKNWKYPHDCLPKSNDEVDTAARSAHRNGLQSKSVDSSDLNRYMFDRKGFYLSSESETSADENEVDRPIVKDTNIASNDDYALASDAATTYEWALPAAKDVEGLPNNTDSSDHEKSRNYELDGAGFASSSFLLENKVLAQEIKHAGAKKELLYTDGSRKIIFPDGNEKDIDANGHTVIRFTNGDYKELFPVTGICIYYYYKTQTKLTTYPDNRKVYEFPNDQLETVYPDGSIEIQFPDGIKKTICSNGDEFSIFPDGTTMVEQRCGLREVTLLNKKKIRYFPDGQMVCVSRNAQEIHIRSDHELKQLMEST